MERNENKTLTMNIIRREADMGAVKEKVTVSTAETAIIVVDMWDYHWCKTWVGRAGSMIPRLNRALSVARGLGIKIVHAPTDVVNSYSGYEQRERMAALPDFPVPESFRAFRLPLEDDLSLLRKDIPDIPRWAGDMCGSQYKCVPNYGEYRLDAGMEIHADDWISANGQELYNLCRLEGIRNLIYMGGATNVCVLIKQEGMLNMSAAGFNCIIARDMTEAYSAGYCSDSLDDHTAEAVRYIERYIGSSVDLVETFRASGRWDDSWIVNQVLICPWGHRRYPQLFEGTMKVTMSAPNLSEAEIRYTIDGSEPKNSSLLYSGPVMIEKTTVLRAAAFCKDDRISLESESFFTCIPEIPQLPDIFISDLQPKWATVKGYVPWWSSPDKGSKSPPVMDRSYDGSPLVLRGVPYDKGIGVDSPSQLLYEVKPEYDYFVARAGICESLLANDLGREAAVFPEVIFKVFINGKLMAESIVMHISEEPWRFEIKIPEGSHVISLVTNTTVDGRSCDMCNWVDAGFVLKKAR